MVIPQRIGGEFVFLGGVQLIKSLFESQQPQLDLIFSLMTLVVSYLTACILVWIYETKINKVITSIEEIDVPPPGEDDEEEEDE